jgi:predicted ATPase
LHWAGEASLALFEWLARRAAGHSILILATYRGEEIDRNHPLRRLRRNLEWDRSGEHLSLDRLSAEAVADLLGRVTEFQSATPDVVRWLRDKSEGNPLFIEFFVQHWLDAGCPPRASAQDPIAIPGGIQALITRRLECLSEQARLLSEIASVVGVTFDIETIEQVSGWEEHQTLSTLNELLDRRLVQEAGARSEGPFEFVFSHHLIQSVIYTGIPERHLRRWHLRVGQAMEGLALRANRPDDWAGELGRHFAQGGDARRAVPYLLTAARQALALYADEQALRVISQAVALLDQARDFGEPAARLHWLWELLALREDVEHRHGHRQAQQSDLERMDQIAEQTRPADLAFECLQRWARYWHVTGQRQQETLVCEALQRRAQETGEPSWQAEALRANATLQIALGHVSSATPQSDLEQALALYRRAGHVAGQVSCLCLLTDAAVQQGHFKDAQARLEQARHLAQVDGDYTLLVQTLRAASGALFAQQDFVKAQQTATQMLDLCRSIDDREGEADSLARLGTISARLFAIQAAREYYAQARALYADLGKRQGQAGVLVNTGVLATRLGHYAEGQLAFEQAGELFQILEDVRGQAVCALNLCMAAYFQSEFVLARDAAARGLELARQMSSQVMEANALANLGAAERELGQLPEAIAHMETGLIIRRTLRQVAELGTDLCDLVVAYVRQGSLEVAQRAVIEMLDIYNQHEQTTMHPQYILWAAAQTFWAAGEESRAREYLDRACAVMQDKARAIPNDDSRACFLELPFNREIRLACEQGKWPA